MNKIRLGEALSILANVGVVGGILLLVYELRQNNDLMAAEARFNRLTIAVDSWRYNAGSADLAELRAQARNGEALSDAERWRVDGSIMAIFVMLEWTFRELPGDSPEMNQVRQVQQYNFANDVSYGEIWEDRKISFDPEFVQWMQENVIDVVNER